MNILVVDDKPAIQLHLTQLLSSLGYTVDCAANGLDAYEKAQIGNYQLYVIDHLMPLMNGLQLSKNLKKLHHSQHPPIIFMTTQSLKDINRLAESSLFSSVHNKPINDDELIHEVITLLPDSNPTFIAS